MQNYPLIANVSAEPLEVLPRTVRMEGSDLETLHHRKKGQNLYQINLSKANNDNNLTSGKTLKNHQSSMQQMQDKM